MKPQHVYTGRAEALILKLPQDSISAVICSPPYAEQRDGHYPGIDERVYPHWFANIMAALMPKLKADANVIVVINPHVRDGNVSDYVMKTRLAVRDLGYLEPDEVIWHKSDGCPLGDCRRPRRCHEQILWFAKGRKPWLDLRACGKESDRIGWDGSLRYSGIVHATKRTPVMKKGRSRVTNVFSVGTGGMSKEGAFDHPARYPLELAEQLVQTYCRPRGICLDPFVGSGTTLEACVKHGRHWIGFDAVAQYARLARRRAAQHL